MNRILITGACGALGKAICETIHKNDESIQLIGLCHSKRDLLSYVDYHVVDQSMDGAVDALPTEIFNVDVLINNASMKPDVAISHKRDLDDFENHLQVGFLSHVALTHKCMKFLLKNKGSIVNILSSYTCEETPKGCAPYVSQKYALLGYTKALQEEYWLRGVKSYCVSPRVMDTPFLNDLPAQIKQGLLEQKCVEVYHVAEKVFELIHSQSEIKDNILI